jgi:hypothetical protein
MNVPRTPPRHCDSGSTLTEMLVAGALGLLALSMLASNVLPAIGTLGRTGEPDAVAGTLHLAADEAVRLVSSARDGATERAVSATDDGIVLRIPGEHGSPMIRLAIVDGELIIDAVDGGVGSPSGAVRVLADGLAGTSRIEVVGRTSDEADPPVAARIHLEREGRVVRRLVRIRS